MWEKCVGCGEGIFAGDAFCGNCGRPVTTAVPAAREPDGLKAARPAASAADRGQVRIPAGHRAGAPGQADPEQADPEQAAPDQAAPRQSAPEQAAPGQSAPEQNDATRHDRTRQRDGTNWHEAGGAPGAKEPGRRAAPKLSGPATLDPVRNPRYLAYVLRQAGVFTGIYLLVETVLLLCLLLDAAAGTKFGPALRLELDSLWLVALVLAIPFWLIPVPALLAEWSLVMEQRSDATQTAFQYINSAFQADGTPVDSLRVRTASRHEEGDREYLELRRDHFSGYISCFAHGRDMYVGWTFWLHMSPLRLLMMVIGRNIRDMTSRGDGIYRSLRFESTRALVAAMHGATLAGIDAANGELDPVGPPLARETAINMNVELS